MVSFASPPDALYLARMAFHASAPTARSRRPQGTLLHGLVDQHFGDYLLAREELGKPVSSIAIREFQRYLRCGDITAGHAKLFCDACHFEHDIPFSCKQRGWCSYCIVRRMMDRSTFLGTHVLGDTPIRHWALALPPPLRYGLAFDSSLTSDVLAIHVESIFKLLRRQAKFHLGLASEKLAHPGSMSVIHRASKNLAVSLHFHSLVTDGVYVRDGDDGPLVFHQLPPPTRSEVLWVAWETCRRTVDLLRRRGMWQDLPDAAGDDQTIHGRVQLGSGTPPHTVRFTAIESRREQLDVARQNGAGPYPFDIWAKQRIRSGDHYKRDKLLRYVLGPAFTDDQLSLTPTGDIVLELARPRWDGTTTRTFSRDGFFDALVHLVPRPRVNLTRFHGVYASHSALRAEAVPTIHEPPPMTADAATNDAGREAWCLLLARAHLLDTRCPRCSGQLRLIALKADILTYSRIFGLPVDTPGPPRIETDQLQAAP